MPYTVFVVHPSAGLVDWLRANNIFQDSLIQLTSPKSILLHVPVLIKPVYRVEIDLEPPDVRFRLRERIEPNSNFYEEVRRVQFKLSENSFK